MEFVTDILDTDGSIKRRVFTFNGHVYEIIGTGTKARGESPLKARDTLKRDDGKIIELSRYILRDYFSGRLKDKKALEIDMKVIQEAR